MAAALALGVQGARAAGADEAVVALVDRIQLGGAGRWDYAAVDDERHRLYVTRGDRVQVLGTDDGRLLGELGGLDGAHGVAFAAEQVFVTEGKANRVAVFERGSLRRVDAIAVPGVNPDAILFEPVRGLIYTMNHRSGDISVIDPATRRVLGRIAALGELEFAVSDAAGRILVNSEAAGAIAVIDPVAMRMTAQWPLGGCEAPTGLALDAAHARLFAVCANRRMSILDAATGRLVAQLPIGGRPDAAAFDAQLGLAYASNGEGSLTVVHEDDPEHFRVVQELPTAAGARTMALDARTHRLYLPLALRASGTAAADPFVPDSFQLLVVAPAGAAH